MADLSRRGFLGSMAAAGVIAALPAPLRAEPVETVTVDVPNGVLRVGDVFTIAGAYAVGGRRKLQQFTVTGSTSRNRFMLERARSR